MGSPSLATLNRRALLRPAEMPQSRPQPPYFLNAISEFARPQLEIEILKKSRALTGSRKP